MGVIGIAALREAASRMRHGTRAKIADGRGSRKPCSARDAGFEAATPGRHHRELSRGSISTLARSLYILAA